MFNSQIISYLCKEYETISHHTCLSCGADSQPVCYECARTECTRNGGDTR